MAARPDGDGRDTILLGPSCLDRYIDEGLVLPGGGALNMAHHWSSMGFPFRLITRTGDDSPGLFMEFLDRHGIRYSAESIVAAGPSSSIDIVMRDDRQPWMDNFIEGVWSGFRLDEAEEGALSGAGRLHAVLVDPVVREVERLGAAGRLDHVSASGDFLDFRHYTVERFAGTMRYLDIGFVGWPGDPGHPTLAGIRDAAFGLGRLVLVTLGSRGIRVFDGAAGEESFVPVAAVPVTGTTVGCGDAFIAAFLAARWSGVDMAEAIGRAKALGAAATAWHRPLPESAYADRPADRRPGISA